MNPYLEQDDVWHDFNEKFIPAIAEHLVPQVRPNYIVKIDDHVYVHEFSPEPSRRLLGRADVGIAESEVSVASQAATSVLGVPVRVQVPALDVERVSFVEIRDRRSRELMTVIEVLSPANKRPGPDREQYVAKRQEILNSKVHLVEIDLLRGGPPMPLDDRPSCAYSILVSRAEDRPGAGFWPLQVRDPLPTVPVPLHAADRGARLGFQDVLYRVYDASGYEDYIYSGVPEPPLGPEDRQWAEALVSTDSRHPY
jgi:hypothetical protein